MGVLLLGTCLIYESPRYLVATGRIEEVLCPYCFYAILASLAWLVAEVVLAGQSCASRPAQKEW